MLDFIKYLLDKIFEPGLFFKWRTKVLKDIINDTLLDNKDFAKEEYGMQFIMHVTQCRNREMAKTAFELTQKSKYLVAPNEFKRLYPYLTIENHILKKDESTMDNLNTNNKYMTVISRISFILALIFLFIIPFMNEPTKVINATICVLIFIFISFSILKIQDKEWKHFEETMKKYNSID